MSWVKLKKVMVSLKFGGLGIGSIMTFNLALLFKWIWRFWLEDDWTRHFGLKLLNPSMARRV